MIEVEIKCIPSPEQEAALLANATFLGEKLDVNTYYDSPTYVLSTQDVWLRARNDQFMLKKPASQNNHLSIQHNTAKHEIEDEEQIRHELNLCHDRSLKEALFAAGYNPLYTFTNKRRKYSKEGFIIDLDCAQLGTMTYHLCEIELVVATVDAVQSATDKIIEFIKGHGIDITPVEGKLIQLIKMTNPEHFQALQRAHKKRQLS